MLIFSQKEKLKTYWGDKADSMDCMAEVRVYDPLSMWECYIYAINPEDEDEICCIINGFSVEVTKWSLNHLFSRYNSEGEGLSIDHEYRPRRASDLIKIIRKGCNGSYRD